MENVINAEVRTKESIVTEIKIIYNHVATVASNGFVAIGKNLKDLKELVPHGEWGNYIKENLGFSQSRANKLMQYAEVYGDENSPYFKAISNSYTYTNLEFSKGLALLAVPEDEVEDFVSGEEIDKMTVRELEEKIKELQTEAEAVGDNYVALESDNLMLKDEMEDAMTKLAEANRRLTSLQEKQEGADDNLRKKLAAERAKIEASVREDVRKRLAAEIEETKSAASAAEERASAAEEKLAGVERKMSALGNEDIILFKVKVEEVQMSFNAAMETVTRIHADNPEQAEKLKTALLAILDGMKAAV